MTVIDVGEQDFATEVLERSAALPVVVDFWAEWCGPCRSLGPVLEAAANKREGKVVLAKVDTEANPGLAQAFQIQSIPAVKAFRDGQVAAEFIGAQPPAAVERFFDALVPSEADELVAAGDEASLRRALELEPQRADAAVALAGLLHRRGDSAGALELVENLDGNFAAEALSSRIRVEQAAAATEPGSDERGLVSAFAELDAGETERGLDTLLAALPHVDGHRDDVRRVIVGVLDTLGVEHPLAREARRRLAAALY